MTEYALYLESGPRRRITMLAVQFASFPANCGR
jgi:hypothetical protein